jgi:hypothetical protein
MTETVDQAQAQPPRALAGIIEDATSLSFVSTSHFGGSRGGRLPHGHAVLRQSSHISAGCPCTTSVDIKPEDARLDDTRSAAPVKLTVGGGGAGAQDGTPAAPVRARSRVNAVLPRPGGRRVMDFGRSSASVCRPG